MERDKIVKRLKGCTHKVGVNKSDWDKVHKNLALLAEYVLDHCESHQLPLVITSIIRPKIKGVSKTDIHAKGRAFDMSILGWSKEDIQFLVDCCNEEMTIGAISLSDGNEKEAIFEPAEYDKFGNQVKWPHFHFQVRP